MLKPENQALVNAVRAGSPDGVRAAIDAGANPSIQHGGQDMLRLATKTRNWPVFKVLVEAGGRMQGARAGMELVAASNSGWIEHLPWMLERFDPMHLGQGANGRTAAGSAAYRGNLPALKALHAAGVDIRLGRHPSPDRRGPSNGAQSTVGIWMGALTQAVHKRRKQAWVEGLEWLMEITPPGGAASLGLGACLGNCGLNLLGVEMGRQLACSFFDGPHATPAARRAMVHGMLNHAGADTWWVDLGFRLAQQGHVDLNKQENLAGTMTRIPLHAIAARLSQSWTSHHAGHEKAHGAQGMLHLRRLLDAGARWDVLVEDAPDEGPWPLVFWAARQKHFSPQMLDTMVASGVDLSAACDAPFVARLDTPANQARLAWRGASLAHVLAWSLNARALEALLDHEPGQVHARDPGQATPIHRALLPHTINSAMPDRNRKALDVVGLLIDRGAPIDAVDDKGNSIIHFLAASAFNKCLPDDWRGVANKVLETRPSVFDITTHQGQSGWQALSMVPGWNPHAPEVVQAMHKGLQSSVDGAASAGPMRRL